MRSHRLPLVVPCFLFLTACMVSEQIGEEPQNLSFHFDTSFNQILLFGRSGALAAFAFWVYSAWGKRTGPTIIAIAVLGASGWLFARDYPSMKDYRVDVLEQGLQLNIPPDPEAFVPWDSIERLELAGYEWMHVPMPGGAGTPFAPPRAQYAWEELPEWETMDIQVAGEGTYTLNLKPLSIEQRQILSRAIVKRANLIKE